MARNPCSLLSAAPPPSRTNWTRLVPRPVLTGHLAVVHRLLRWTRGEQAARSDKLLEAARRRVWAEALQEHTELSGVTVTIQKNFKALRRAPRPAPRSAGAAMPREGRARLGATF